ncbi:hypothetical protein chiPu_0020533 [Chiloscyllium punctatum]|uniref:ER membrane protein complex subunit 6 n=2 Tax=Orectolobiformes TaxID=30503 RepID=A0A401RGV3_CHIPU|nr:hypothetical protein [Chiloscyllium punctatum]
MVKVRAGCRGGANIEGEACERRGRADVRVGVASVGCRWGGVTQRDVHVMGRDGGKRSWTEWDGYMKEAGSQWIGRTRKWAGLSSCVPRRITELVMAAVGFKREGPQFISELAVRGNAAILDYCRTSVSALSGATAGILGLTALTGFIFYFVASFLLSVLLIVKAGRRWSKYFKSRRPLFTGGLVGGLFTYILFWTFLYGMVHVY